MQWGWWLYRRYAFCVHVRGERRSQELTPDEEVEVNFAVGCCRIKMHQTIYYGVLQRF